MDKKKIIIIKNQVFRNFRNNLRKILIDVANKEWKRIYEQMILLEKDMTGNFRSVGTMSSEERVKFRSLQKKLFQVQDLVNRSICKCFACNDFKSDMVYNPTYSAWYCIKCYEASRHFYRISKGEKKDDCDRGYFSSFTTVS